VTAATLGRLLSILCVSWKSPPTRFVFLGWWRLVPAPCFSETVEVIFFELPGPFFFANPGGLFYYFSLFFGRLLFPGLFAVLMGRASGILGCLQPVDIFFEFFFGAFSLADRIS